MGRPDYIFGQFRETARCCDAQLGDGVCCAFAPQLVSQCTTSISLVKYGPIIDPVTPNTLADIGRRATHFGCHLTGRKLPRHTKTATTWFRCISPDSMKNSLPLAIRSSVSTYSFRRQLKTFFYNLAFRPS